MDWSCRGRNLRKLQVCNLSFARPCSYWLHFTVIIVGAVNTIIGMLVGQLFLGKINEAVLYGGVRKPTVTGHYNRTFYVTRRDSIYGNIHQRELAASLPTSYVNQQTSYRSGSRQSRNLTLCACPAMIARARGHTCDVSRLINLGGSRVIVMTLLPLWWHTLTCNRKNAWDNISERPILVNI